MPLAAEVDALLEAREAQVATARARAGDLAHGLKTPLQVLVGDVGRLRTKGEGEIADEIEQVATSMRRHVDRELGRARMATRGTEASARIADVVQRVVAVIVRTRPARGSTGRSISRTKCAAASARTTSQKPSAISSKTPRVMPTAMFPGRSPGRVPT